MQQSQHEKSQFCTEPGSPANHEGAMRAHPGNWEMKAKFFSALCTNSSALHAAFTSVQFLCPGDFSILATPLVYIYHLHVSAGKMSVQ